MSNIKPSMPITSELIGIEQEQNIGPVLEICWMLHGQCNNRCTYCQPYNHSGTHGWLTLDKAKNFIDRLLKHYSFKNHFKFFFTGGEPTLWPDFLQLCQYIKEKCPQAVIGVNSNGSRPISYWNELADFVSELVISYHPEFPRDEQILQIVDTCGWKSSFAVRIMLPKDRVLWQRSIDFGEKVKNLKEVPYSYCEYVPLQENFGNESHPVEYFEDQNEFWKNATLQFNIRNRGKNFSRLEKLFLIGRQEVYQDGSRSILQMNKLVAENKVNFQNWKCYIGVDLLFVDAEGYIFKGGCKVGGRLGHIYDVDLEFPTKPVTCPKTFCPCGTDLQTRKFNPDFEHLSSHKN